MFGVILLLFYQLFPFYRLSFSSIRIDILWAQLLLDFSTDQLETMRACSTWYEDVRVALGLTCHYLFLNFCTFSTLCFRCDTMTWVACGRNYSDSFAPNVLKLCRCFCHGLKICLSSHYLYPLFQFFRLFSDPISIRYLVGATYPTVFHL